MSVAGGVRQINRLVNRDRLETEATLQRAMSLLVDATTISDLHQIGMGVYAPLEGFLGESDYQSVLARMRLADGTVWPVPVTLPVAQADAVRVASARCLALRSADGVLHGLLHVSEAYRPQLEAEAISVYGTADKQHPGVAALFARGSVYLAGLVDVAAESPGEWLPDAWTPHFYTPAETRRAFAKRGWRTVVGFQTRNPVHRAHEYIQKCALETVDGLFLNPLVGPTKADDVPATVRMRAYEVLLANYYPGDRVLLGLHTGSMRYAGPREAVLHAIARRNFGCTHFIVGRNHAGVGDYYGPYDAQHIFSQFAVGELGIQPVFFEEAFFCQRCGSMTTSKTCPHPQDAHLTLSGTRVRELLCAGLSPPPEFSRPEVAQVLLEAYRLS